jgi:hypothetical protein
MLWLFGIEQAICLVDYWIDLQDVYSDSSTCALEWEGDFDTLMNCSLDMITAVGEAYDQYAGCLGLFS